jgi:hypothetical protein
LRWLQIILLKFLPMKCARTIWEGLVGQRIWNCSLVGHYRKWSQNNEQQMMTSSSNLQ